MTATATVFAVASSRGGAVIRGLLGSGFAGHLVSDRWSAYGWLPDGRRQLCWAHLTRAFQALVDRGGRGRPLGAAALRLIDELFVRWHAARDDPARRAAFADEIAPLKAQLHALLDHGLDNPVKDANDLCDDLLLHWPALWTFATVPGVDPTNNAAERALRPAVLWRKGSFGTQNDAGSLFVARMLSAAATCHQQQRSLLAYLADACAAAQRRQPSPSLLPATPLPLAARTLTVGRPPPTWRTGCWTVGRRAGSGS